MIHPYTKIPVLRSRKTFPLTLPLGQALYSISDPDQTHTGGKKHAFYRRIFQDMPGERKDAPSLRPHRTAQTHPRGCFHRIPFLQPRADGTDALHPTAKTLRFFIGGDPGDPILLRRTHTFFKTAAAKGKTDTKKEGGRADDQRALCPPARF